MSPALTAAPVPGWITSYDDFVAGEPEGKVTVGLAPTFPVTLTPADPAGVALGAAPSSDPHAAANKIKGTAASTARARRMDVPRKDVRFASPYPTSG
ncbi:hypothetical protein GCM10022419_043150 [Nonomuraea rosea]|uniref:Uncharacterized protein n=1 Tax=Nonomuraea rosea TaxID=638574 RepID=A0ABP6WWR1_9ACTN